MTGFECQVTNHCARTLCIVAEERNKPLKHINFSTSVCGTFFEKSGFAAKKIWEISQKKNENLKSSKKSVCSVDATIFRDSYFEPWKYLEIRMTIQCSVMRISKTTLVCSIQARSFLWRPSSEPRVCSTVMLFELHAVFLWNVMFFLSWAYR